MATPWGPRSSTADTTVAPTTATSTAGTFVVMRGRTRSTARTAQAGHQCRRFAAVESLEEGPDLVDEPVGIGGEPEELGELTDDDGDGQAVEVADADLAGEQVGDEAEPGNAEADLDEPDEEGEHAGEGDGAGRVAGDHQGEMAARISGETDESGPRTRTCEGPKTA